MDNRPAQLDAAEAGADEPDLSDEVDFSDEPDFFSDDPDFSDEPDFSELVDEDDSELPELLTLEVLPASRLSVR